VDLGPWEVVILLVVFGVPITLIFLAVILINRRTPPPQYAVPDQPHPVPQDQPQPLPQDQHHSIPPEEIAHLQHLIATRKKIQAIKEIRILTGLGLKEAKDVADALEAGSYDPTALGRPRPRPRPLPPELVAHLQRLLAADKKIQAVKEIRTHTGLGLKQAKDLADALETDHLGPAAPGHRDPLPPERVAHLQRLLAANKKIQAIKEIRTLTGLGLKQAKDLAEAIEDGRYRPTPTPLSERVRALKSTGDHASALALVRAETGMTPTEAERFIQALD
jgi:ribosomal protein L7/L12